MKQMKQGYIFVAALLLAGFMGLQTAQAGIIAASDITNGTNTFTTGDGLVTLTPLAAGLTNGTFGATPSLFGVAGGSNNNAVDDADGSPATTADREAVDIELDATVGLTEIAFVWTTASGPADTNGVPSGIEISGFTEDPGVWAESAPPVVSTYTNGTVYFNGYNFTGTPKVFNFANAAASTGQVLRLSVNDANSAAPQAAISSMAYGIEGAAPPSAPPATGYVSWSNVVSGATSYISGDALLTLTPYSSVSNLTVGAFFSGVNVFGVQGGNFDYGINDEDGDPATTDDRQAIDIDLDGTVSLTQISFNGTRADGAASNGVPAGIVISGFSEDPGVWTESNVESTYTNGAVYLNYAWDNWSIRDFFFTNLTASAGQTLRISVNDHDQVTPQACIHYIAYGDEPILPPPPPPPPAGTITGSNIVNGTISYVTDDGLVTLTPYAMVSNSVVGSFGTAPNLFGVQGGPNNNNVGDLDGDPATTHDREAIDITLDETVGLSLFSVVWARADGPATNDGFVISGFREDPGATHSGGGVINGNGISYSDGSLYMSLNSWSGTPAVFSFSNLGASAGQTLRFGANDSTQPNPQGAVAVIEYTEFIPEVLPADLSIASGSGQVFVTAQNMGVYASNTLQGTTSLIASSWDDIATTTGVEQVTWPVSDSEPIRFFRVKSE